MISGVSLAAIVAMGLLGSAASVDEVVDTGVVDLFAKTCVDGDLTIEARQAVIETDAEWRSADPSNVVTKNLENVPTLQQNFVYNKPTSVRLWMRNIDGKTVRAILATFPDNRRYPNLCAIVVPGVKNAMPYADAFRGVAKAAGLKGKSVDLPHYFEFSGKPQNGHAVRAEVFSRSLVVGAPATMHMYIAF